MIKYRISRHSIKITEVEVLSETKHTLVLSEKTYRNRNRRVHKISYYERYFDTWHAARHHLFQRTRCAIEKLEDDLRLERHRLSELFKMAAPDSAKE